MEDLWKEKVLQIKEELEHLTIDSMSKLNEIKTLYLSKKGPISELLNMMPSLSIEEKDLGKLVNDLKNEITNILEESRIKLENEELNKKLEVKK